MLHNLRRALILPALTLCLAVPAAHADDVAASPAPAASRIMSLTYAPDGQSLWSVTRDGQLTIRTRDGKAMIYRGKVDSGVVMLRVLKDGSFLAGTSEDALQWFEPPQAGEPLKLRREFDGPEARGNRKRLNPTLNKSATDEEKMAAVNNLQFNDLAVSPDEKRVAYSLVKSLVGGAIIYDTPTQEVIRVWNLASSQVESEHIVTTPTLSFKGKVSDEALLGPITLAGLPGSGSKLAWADDQTLVVARGLSLARFDAATGKLVGEWKPEHAPQALATAGVMRQAKYLGMSPAQLKGIVNSAPPRAFDVGAQQLLALSDDGTQLLVFDGVKLLTLWDSATGEVEILSEGSEFVPWRAKTSLDGTKVAAWDNKTIRSWRSKSRISATQLSTGLVTIPPREDAPIWDVALANDRIAFARGTDEIFSIHLGSGSFLGTRPARLKDFQGLAPLTSGSRVIAPR